MEVKIVRVQVQLQLGIKIRIRKLDKIGSLIEFKLWGLIIRVLKRLDFSDIYIWIVG